MYRFSGCENLCMLCSMRSLVLASVIDTFSDRREMTGFRSFNHITIKKILNQLQTIYLRPPQKLISFGWCPFSIMHKFILFGYYSIHIETLTKQSRKLNTKYNQSHLFHDTITPWNDFVVCHRGDVLLIHLFYSSYMKCRTSRQLTTFAGSSSFELWATYCCCSMFS